MNAAGRLFAVAGVAVLALCLVPVGGAADAASSARAQLRVSPNPVARGEVATAYGEGFCSSRRCSAVSIVLDAATVASVAPRKDGSFVVRFRVSEAAGRYTVAARQTAPNGSRAAVTSLTVQSDTTTTTKPPPRTTTTTTSRATTTRTSTTRRTTTSTTTLTTTAAGTFLPAPETTSSAPPSDAVLADAPPNEGAGFLDLLRWLLPGAVVMLAVIGVAAWRGRAPGAHHR